MKILEEKKLKGLKKEFLVEIPFSDLDDLKQKKLKDISEKVKIAGFRPGKVPLSHVDWGLAKVQKPKIEVPQSV